MKRLLGVFLLALTVTQPAPAEDSGYDCHRDRIFKELQLSEDQAGTVKQIMKEKREKQMVIMEETRPKMEALYNETREQLAAVLDDEQLSKFDEIEETKHNKRKEWRSRHPGF